MKFRGLNLRCASLLIAFALASACSGVPLKQRLEADRTRYEAYAGPPVDHFTYLLRSRDNAWAPLSPTELVMWISPLEVYLLKVAEPCEDLTFARDVDVTSSTDMHSVYTGIDFVRVGRFTCPIQEIRPVDYKRLQADLRK